MNKEDIIHDLDRSTATLQWALQQFDDRNFNEKGSAQWSAGDTAEHIWLLESFINTILPFSHATGRQHDQKIAAIKSGMENTTRKFIAPEFIHPTSTIKTPGSMIQKIVEQRNQLKEIIRHSDLSETTDSAHPSIGEMTRMEWIYFIIHHASRHVQQMQKLHAEIVSPAGDTMPGSAS